MFVPFSRIMAVAMAGVLCFALIVPMALANHKPLLAIGLGVLFVAYAITNVVLWQRMKRRA